MTIPLRFDFELLIVIENIYLQSFRLWPEEKFCKTTSTTKTRCRRHHLLTHTPEKITSKCFQGDMLPESKRSQTHVHLPDLTRLRCALFRSKESWRGERKGVLTSLHHSVSWVLVETLKRKESWSKSFSRNFQDLGHEKSGLRSRLQTAALS